VGQTVRRVTFQFSAAADLRKGTAFQTGQGREHVQNQPL
jgi:hypothetical protein